MKKELMNKIANTTIDFVKTTKAVAEVAKEVKYAAIMPRINYGYGLFLSRDKNYDVGTVTNCAEAFTSLLNGAEVNRAGFIAITKIALEKALIDEFTLEQFAGETDEAFEAREADFIEARRARFGKGTKKYVGLLLDTLGDKDLITTKKDYEIAIIEEIFEADLNDFDNLYKIVLDFNAVFRGYQEMTIDAAKKLYVIIYNFFIETLRHMSVYHLYACENEAGDFFKGFKRSEELKVGRLLCTSNNVKVMEFKNSKEMFSGLKFFNGAGVEKTVFTDSMAVIQNELVEELVASVNGSIKEAYENAKVDAELVKQFEFFKGNELYADLYTYIKTAYGNVFRVKAERFALIDAKDMGNFRKEMEKFEVEQHCSVEIARINDTARVLTQNLPLVEVGKIMYCLSKLESVANGNNKVKCVNEDSTNTMFLSIMPEAITAYFAAQNGANKEGYRLSGESEVMESLVGQTIVMEVGNDFINDLVIDEAISGEFTVVEEDGCFYAVKDIEVKRPEVPKFVDVQMYLAKDKAMVNACKAIGFDCTNIDKVKKALTSASVEVHKEFKIGNVTLKNVITAVSQTGVKVPVCRLSAGSNEVANVLIGLNKVAVGADAYTRTKEFNGNYTITLRFDATSYDEVIREQLNVVEEEFVFAPSNEDIFNQEVTAKTVVAPVVEDVFGAATTEQPVAEPVREYVVEDVFGAVADEFVMLSSSNSYEEEDFEGLDMLNYYN